MIQFLTKVYQHFLIFVLFSLDTFAQNIYFLHMFIRVDQNLSKNSKKLSYTVSSMSSLKILTKFHAVILHCPCTIWKKA